MTDQPVVETHRGTPRFAYGQAKAEISVMAAVAARDGIAVTVARPFNVIGAGVPDCLVVGALVKRLRDAITGPPPRAITVGVTSSVRDFIDAEDVARGMVAVARRGTAGEAYNLCTGRGHTVAEIVERLRALAGGEIAVRDDPSLSRAGEVSALVGSPAKAARLGWRAERSLDDSLRAAWDSSAPAAR